MASAGAQYTVFGFDSRIDWKPTVFVDGLPKNRVCSACGLVSAAIALLPCTHLLCSRCYDGSGDGERTLCPLDKDACESEDVIWTTFAKEKLLRRKIQCWNSSRGCVVEGEVSEVVDHFDGDCQYHAVTCSRCKQSMAYKELLGHLETVDCSVPETNAASISHAIPDATITPLVDAVGQLRDQLSSLQTGFRESKEVFTAEVQVFRERAAADTLVAESLQSLENTLKESAEKSRVAAGRTAERLALLRSSTSAIVNTLSEVVVLVNKINASLSPTIAEHAREISAGCRNLQEKLDGLSACSTKAFEKSGKKLDLLQSSLDEHVRDKLDVKESLKHLNERLSDEFCQSVSLFGKIAKVVSELPLCKSEPLVWTVEKWSELKKEAAANGQAGALFEKQYFYGYYIHPGILMMKANEDIVLHLQCYVRQGGYDLLLSWPLQKLLGLKVLDAEGKEIPQCISLSTTNPSFEEYKMPQTARNGGVHSKQCIKVTDIERIGCVKNDKVSFKFTVSQL